MELYFQDTEHVKETEFWSITKDEHYYYKTLNEQNYAALDGKMRQNLEFMMNPTNYVTGVNPVMDIYYLDDYFIAYRTKIVNGLNTIKLKSKWCYNLDMWKPFLLALIRTINDGTKSSYCFPDLFTPGNILYDISSDTMNFIDNDGIQTEDRFVYIRDFIAASVIDIRNYNPIFRTKYFHFKKRCFMPSYNVLCFYSYFFYYFLGFDLPKFLNFSKDDLCSSLKQMNISTRSSFGESVMDLSSMEPSEEINPILFEQICDNYKIDYDDQRRILAPR